MVGFMIAASRLDLLQHEVVAGTPSLADEVKLTIMNVQSSVVYMLRQLDPEVLFRANGGQELIALCIKNEYRRGTKFLRVVAETADHRIPAVLILNVANPTRKRSGWKFVRSNKATVSIMDLNA